MKCRAALPLLLLCACAGRGAPPPLTAKDEPLLGEEDSHKEPPARGAQRPPPEHLEEHLSAASVEPPPAPPPPPEAPAQRGKVRFAGARGIIRRAELLQVLDRSPAAFLRRVESEPHIEGGRFRGWTIASFFAGDARFSGIDLVRGDVVTRVNGLPIEMPEQFINVWQQLRQARELRVDLLRNGQPHVSRWTIVD